MIQKKTILLNHPNGESDLDSLSSRLLIDFSDLPTTSIEEYATSSEQISLLCGLNRRGSRRISKVVCRVLYCFRPATLVEHSVSLVSDGSGWALRFRFVTDPIDVSKPQTASALNNLVRSGGTLDQFEIIGEPTHGCTIQCSQKLPSQFEVPTARELKQWLRVIGKGSWEDAFEAVTRHYLSDRAKLKQLRDGISIRREVLNDDQQQANTLLSLIAGKTDNAVMLLDGVGKIEWVNDATCQTFDLDAKRILNTRVQTLFFSATDARSSKADAEASLDPSQLDFGKSLERGHSFTVEYFREPNSEISLWISFQLTPVRDEHDIIVRWIAIGSDVTQRRKAELAMQSAKEAAENANRAKSDFLAMMSHEIRTPMNAIIGMTELALGTALTSEQHEFLTTAHQSSQSLLQILNDILDLSKVEAARLTLEQIEFSLADLVRETMDTLIVLANNKGITLTSSFPPSVPDRLIGDPVRIRQVFMNLLGNAIKFTNQGKVEFLGVMIDETPTEVTLHCTVRDTGVGIAQEKTSRIFEAFYQADASVNRNFGGTGLGLAITAELVELMGGQIWVESQLGVGSSFHFVVSLAKPNSLRTRNRTRARRATAVEIGSPVTPAVQREPIMASLAANPLNILVVDDHPSNRTLACEILRRRGHHCQQCSSGVQAFQQLKQERFDVVLMDLQMPEQDGLETTQKIFEQLPELSRLPIIALTAYVTKEDRDRCADAGMVDYLSKPVNARVLIETVERWGNVATPLAAQSAAPKIEIAHFQSALDRLGGDNQLLQLQMGFFLDETPQLLEHLRTAIIDQDAPTLHLNAHRLKGLVQCYDDPTATRLATALEQLSLKVPSFEAAAAMLQELSESIGPMRQRIEAHLNGRRD